MNLFFKLCHHEIYIHGGLNSALFYYRHKLSVVVVTEIMALHGIPLSQQTVRQWEIRFGTDISIKFSAVANSKYPPIIEVLGIEAISFSIYIKA